MIAEGLVRDYPLTIRHASGRTIDVLYNAVVYRNQAGQVQGVFAAARDVTERKQAEEELTRYREHLEELVGQRTAELETANRQLESEIAERKHAAEVLRSTADELARSNKELEQFAYVTSHDLQEPLRVITGYLQLIQRRYQGKIDADVDQFMEYTVDGAARMQQLFPTCCNTRGWGRRASGSSLPIWSACCKRHWAACKRRSTTARWSPTIRYRPWKAMKRNWAQLLQNLIANGIKFRGQCPPQIHVSAQRAEGQWRFSVRDNGIGIEPRYSEQIFVIFRRLHARQKYEGTGIGLAICKKIAEHHGGKIWLDSKPGEGTTFYFTLGRA